MAVAHDASSVSHVNSSNQSSASFTWSHAGAASGVKAVAVWTLGTIGASHTTTVTYGGTELTAITGGLAVDAAEAMFVKGYFLGASVPQGTQDIVVTRTNDAIRCAAFAATCLADTDCEYAGVVI